MKKVLVFLSNLFLILNIQSKLEKKQETKKDNKKLTEQSAKQCAEQYKEIVLKQIRMAQNAHQRACSIKYKSTKSSNKKDLGQKENITRRKRTDKIKNYSGRFKINYLKI